MRIKALTMIVMAMGCGIVAAVGVSQIEDRSRQQDATTRGVKIFIADAAIRVGEPFTPQNVRLERRPLDRVPDGAITRLEDLQHRLAQRQLMPGEALRRGHLLDPTRVSAVAVEAVSVTADESVLAKTPHAVLQEAFPEAAELRGMAGRQSERTANPPSPFVVHISMSVHPPEGSTTATDSEKWRRSQSNLGSPRSSDVTETFVIRDPHFMPADETWQGSEATHDLDHSKRAVPQRENVLTEED